MNGFRWILGLEEEKLGDDDVGSVVGYRAIDANDPLLEQTREYIVGTLPPGRVLNHHRYKAVPSPIFSTITTPKWD